MKHDTRILRPFIFSTLTDHLFSSVYPMHPHSTAPECHPHDIAPSLMPVQLADDNTQGSSRRVNMRSGRIIATTIPFSRVWWRCYTGFVGPQCKMSRLDFTFLFFQRSLLKNITPSGPIPVQKKGKQIVECEHGRPFMYLEFQRVTYNCGGY
jgi:hypothetical protein